MFSCCLHYILALPTKCHSGNRDSSDYTVFFPPSLQSLYCSIMVFFCKLYPPFPVFHRYERHAGTLWPICINSVQHFADGPLHSLEAASGGCDFLYALFHLSDSDHHGYISTTICPNLDLCFELQPVVFTSSSTWLNELCRCLMTVLDIYSDMHLALWLVSTCAICQQTRCHSNRQYFGLWMAMMCYCQAFKHLIV